LSKEKENPRQLAGINILNGGLRTKNWCVFFRKVACGFLRITDNGKKKLIDTGFLCFGFHRSDVTSCYERFGFFGRFFGYGLVFKRIGFGFSGRWIWFFGFSGFGSVLTGFWFWLSQDLDHWFFSDTGRLMCASINF
jgi:hypothetical protein